RPAELDRGDVCPNDALILARQRLQPLAHRLDTRRRSVKGCGEDLALLGGHLYLRRYSVSYAVLKLQDLPLGGITACQSFVVPRRRHPTCVAWAFRADL